MARLTRVRLVCGAVAAAVLAGEGSAGAGWVALLLAADAAGSALWLTWRPAGRRNRRPAVAPDSVVLRAVCHELRTPVSSLGSLTRALGDERCDAAPHVRRELARLAHDQAVHVDGLLRRVTAVTGGLDGAAGARRRVPLGRVLPAASAAVPAGRLSVTVTPAAARRVVDAQRTQQILTNLLENAARYGPPDGTVRLTAWAEPRGLVLRVADGGALTPRLVQALHRATPPPGMSGLGLWLTRRLVEADGGAITAHELPGHGLVIDVVLPPSP